jgi:predicted DNA-binding protein YlxM (UPF0122 family)
LFPRGCNSSLLRDAFPWISEALQLSRQGIYGIIKTLNEKLAGKEKEVLPHRLSTTDEFVDERRQLVEEMMDEKDEDSNYKIRYASELRRRIRIEAPTFMCSLRTLQRDLNELGHTWRALTQAMTEQHKQRRVDSVDNLLSYDHTKIIFSDESYFDCSDHHAYMWCRGDEPPAPRPKERYTAKVMVWGIIAHGLKFLVLQRWSDQRRRVQEDPARVPVAAHQP